VTYASKELFPPLGRDECIHGEHGIAAHVLQLGQLGAVRDLVVV